MFLLHATNCVFTKFNLFKGPFVCSKSSSRYLHTINKLKHRNTFKSDNGKWKSSIKWGQKEKMDTVYMRDIVQNISNTLKSSPWDSAKEHLESLTVKWDSFTVNQVLKTHPPMEKAYLFFNWASGVRGFKHDQFTYTTMLDIFGEARRISSMKFIFEQMQDKGIKADVVTYTSLVHWLSNDGDIDGAIKMWTEMKRKGCHPTIVSYTAYMKVLFNHKKEKEAIDIYKEMCESGLSPTCYTFTVLMEHLIDSGKCKSALEIFSKMQDAGVQPDKAACNILIEKLSKSGDTWAIIHVLHFMKENLLVLRYPVYLLALDVLRAADESDDLLRLVNPHISIEDDNDISSIQPEEYAIDVHAAIDRGLILIFLKKKNYQAINRLLAQVGDNMKLDPVAISVIINSSCVCGKLDTALSALDYSLKKGIHIEEAAYHSLVGICIRNQEFARVVQIVDEMAKAGISLEMDAASLLIYRLGISKQLDCALKIFSLLPFEKKNTAIYTALLAACLSSKNADKGIEIFRTMKSEGLCIASGTYNALISGLEKCGRHDDAKHFLQEKKKVQAGSCSLESVASAEESLCDLLFAGLYVL
ncbi:hypothetical protein V2J09_014548 [Rumex salicifolius]